jgi:hypothetical protein
MSVRPDTAAYSFVVRDVIRAEDTWYISASKLVHEIVKAKIVHDWRDSVNGGALPFIQGCTPGGPHEQYFVEGTEGRIYGLVDRTICHRMARVDQTEKRNALTLFDELRCDLVCDEPAE